MTSCCVSDVSDESTLGENDLHTKDMLSVIVVTIIKLFLKKSLVEDNDVLNDISFLSEKFASMHIQNFSELADGHSVFSMIWNFYCLRFLLFI